MADELLFDSDPDDVPELTPHDRLRAVAAIFAEGISRLQTASATLAEPRSDDSYEPTAIIEKVP